MKPTKKLHPYKVLVYLTWGEYSGKTIIGPGRIKVRSTTMCRLLRIKSDMFRTYLRELERMQLISDLVLVEGAAYLTIRDTKLGY